MNQAKYPLEQLAIIKQKRVEEAEKVLKEKRELLAKEEEKFLALCRERDAVKEHKEAKLNQLRETLDAGTTSDKIQQMKNYLKEVTDQLKAKEAKVHTQQKQLDLAKEAVEIARKERIKKQQEVEKLKLHREEWEKELAKEEERIQGIETDELGSSMFVRKTKKGKKRH